jgi:hypothetical protein
MRSVASGACQAALVITVKSMSNNTPYLHKSEPCRKAEIIINMKSPLVLIWNLTAASMPYQGDGLQQASCKTPVPLLQRLHQLTPPLQRQMCATGTSPVIAEAEPPTRVAIQPLKHLSISAT